MEDGLGLLNLLPETWRPWAELSLEVVVGLAVVVAPVLKSLLAKVYGDPHPDDTGRKVLWYKLAIGVDFLAANSTPVLAKLKHARESMRPPPRPSMRPGPMLLLVLPLFALACGAAPLQAHAKVAHGTAELVAEAGQLLEQRLRQVEEAALAASATREEAAERIGRLRASHAPLEAAYEALRVAHAAYVDAILRAAAEGRDQPKLDVLATLSAAWVELDRRAQLLGLLLPHPPPSLTTLLGGQQ